MKSWNRQRAAWTVRFQQMNNRWVAMNGNTYLYPVSFGIAELQYDRSSGLAAGAANMVQALDDAQQVMDFGIANYLASFAVDSYGGGSSLAWLRDYAKRPGWTLGAHSIASAFGWWNANGIVGDDELLKVLQRLDHEPGVDVGAELYVDMVLYLDAP